MGICAHLLQPLLAVLPDLLAVDHLEHSFSTLAIVVWSQLILNALP